MPIKARRAFVEEHGALINSDIHIAHAGLPKHRIAVASGEATNIVFITRADRPQILVKNPVTKPGFLHDLQRFGSFISVRHDRPLECIGQRYHGSADSLGPHDVFLVPRTRKVSVGSVARARKFSQPQRTASGNLGINQRPSMPALMDGRRRFILKTATTPSSRRIRFPNGSRGAGRGGDLADCVTYRHRGRHTAPPCLSRRSFFDSQRLENCTWPRPPHVERTGLRLRPIRRLADRGNVPRSHAVPHAVT